MVVFRIKLNNGSYAELRKSGVGDGKAKLLLQILRDVKTRLGYLPSLEEAAKLPDMPEDMGLYDKYCISYKMACKKVTTIEENSQRWRKPTIEERKEMEQQELRESWYQRHMENIKKMYYRGEVVDIGKKRVKQVSDEERERLLKAVIMEYESNNNVMLTLRQLKKSHLFKLYELWNAFGSYDGLCRVLEQRLGSVNYNKKIEQRRSQPKSVAKKSEKVMEAIGMDEVKKEVARSPEETVEAKRDESIKAKKEIKKRITDEELIEKMRAYVAIHGGLPTLDGLKKAKEAGEQWPSYNTFIRRFGRPPSKWVQYLEGVDLPTEEAPVAESKLEPENQVENISEPIVEAVLEEESPTGPEPEPLCIHLKLSMTVPGMDKPFELALDLTSD